MVDANDLSAGWIWVVSGWGWRDEVVKNGGEIARATADIKDGRTGAKILGEVLKRMCVLGRKGVGMAGQAKEKDGYVPYEEQRSSHRNQSVWASRKRKRREGKGKSRLGGVHVGVCGLKDEVGTVDFGHGLHVVSGWNQPRRRKTHGDDGFSSEDVLHA